MPYHSQNISQQEQMIKKAKEKTQLFLEKITQIINKKNKNKENNFQFIQKNFESFLQTYLKKILNKNYRDNVALRAKLAVVMQEQYICWLQKSASNIVENNDFENSEKDDPLHKCLIENHKNSTNHLTKSLEKAIVDIENHIEEIEKLPTVTGDINEVIKAVDNAINDASNSVNNKQTLQTLISQTQNKEKCEKYLDTLKNTLKIKKKALDDAKKEVEDFNKSCYCNNASTCDKILKNFDETIQDIRNIINESNTNDNEENNNEENNNDTNVYTLLLVQQEKENFSKQNKQLTQHFIVLFSNTTECFLSQLLRDDNSSDSNNPGDTKAEKTNATTVSELVDIITDEGSFNIKNLDFNAVYKEYGNKWNELISDINTTLTNLAQPIPQQVISTKFTEIPCIKKACRDIKETCKEKLPILKTWLLAEWVKKKREELNQLDINKNAVEKVAEILQNIDKIKISDNNTDNAEINKLREDCAVLKGVLEHALTVTNANVNENSDTNTSIKNSEVQQFTLEQLLQVFSTSDTDTFSQVINLCKQRRQHTLHKLQELEKKIEKIKTNFPNSKISNNLSSITSIYGNPYNNEIVTKYDDIIVLLGKINSAWNGKTNTEQNGNKPSWQQLELDIKQAIEKLEDINKITSDYPQILSDDYKNIKELSNSKPFFNFYKKLLQIQQYISSSNGILDKWRNSDIQRQIKQDFSGEKVTLKASMGGIDIKTPNYETTQNKLKLIKIITDKYTLDAPAPNTKTDESTNFTLTNKLEKYEEVLTCKKNVKKYLEQLNKLCSEKNPDNLKDIAKCYESLIDETTNKYAENATCFKMDLTAHVIKSCLSILENAEKQTKQIEEKQNTEENKNKNNENDIDNLEKDSDEDFDEDLDEEKQELQQKTNVNTLNSNITSFLSIVMPCIQKLIQQQNNQQKSKEKTNEQLPFTTLEEILFRLMQHLFTSFINVGEIDQTVKNTVKQENNLVKFCGYESILQTFSNIMQSKQSNNNDECYEKNVIKYLRAAFFSSVITYFSQDNSEKTRSTNNMQTLDAICNVLYPQKNVGNKLLPAKNFETVITKKITKLNELKKLKTIKKITENEDKNSEDKSDGSMLNVLKNVRKQYSHIKQIQQLEKKNTESDNAIYDKEENSGKKKANIFDVLISLLKIFTIFNAFSPPSWDDCQTQQEKSEKSIKSKREKVKKTTKKITDALEAIKGNEKSDGKNKKNICSQYGSIFNRSEKHTSLSLTQQFLKNQATKKIN